MTAVVFSEKDGRIVLTFVSENEESDWEEDEGNQSSMISIRAELARGDLRALYLGWLALSRCGLGHRCPSRGCGDSCQGRFRSRWRLPDPQRIGTRNER
jgi:hypothetical protein